MKRTIITFLGCAALILPSAAFEKRTFSSADKSKTFEGTLTDYDTKKGVVTVRMAGGRKSSFKLALLSTEDQAYVNENANAIAAAQALRIDFDLYKDKHAISVVKTGSEQTTTTPAGYVIDVRNWSKKDIGNISVTYTIFHRKDAENGPGSIGQTQGSFDISIAFANSDDTNRTLPVNLVRYARQKSGGGC